MTRKHILIILTALLLQGISIASPISQNGNNVTITHPQYKLNIYPKEGGRGELLLKSGGLYPAGKIPQSLFRECFSEQAINSGNKAALKSSASHMKKYKKKGLDNDQQHF